MQFGSLSKNAREELRIEYAEFRGHHLISLRVWAKLDDGTWTATKKGVTVRVSMLPELRQCLAEADKQMRDMGLLRNG
jgi:hypothetical protein